MDIHTGYRLLCYTVYSVSFVMCMLIIILSQQVASSTPKYHQQYAFIVIFNTTIDLIVSSITVFIVPVVVVTENTLFVATENVYLQKLQYREANALLVTDGALIVE
ncbi:unnamed protein product [Bursaphelenchus okinawaensis]|uniref:Serpentine receptor class gamma n=1 Tax=Bursaphelenchus okinawaensis TaxID=465554 RepID=A0A811LJT9_9BILA|nr:unnamed protein product [Bursaphelenchus okinawaensis]CAG9124971.1 unnamed protein product [Bursaphelenchus okinawaensis]